MLQEDLKGRGKKKKKTGNKVRKKIAGVVANKNSLEKASDKMKREGKANKES